MADEQIKPIDQVAAGGTPQPANPAGIIDALRSRGPMPQSALANIMQPPGGLMGMGNMMMPPPPQPANLGLAAGSGMLSGLAGRPNVNPYLTGHTEQQDADYRRQQDMLRMQERMAAQREKQSQAALEIGNSLLESDNPEAQKRGAQTVSTLYKGIYGVDTSPEWWIKQKPITKDERDEIAVEIDAGLTDQMIQARHPKLSGVPGGVGSYRQIMKSDAFQQKFYGSTAEERELKAIDTRGKITLAKDKEQAQARIAAGLGTERDLRIANGDKSFEEVGRDALEQSQRTGQPVPQELEPYVKLFQQKLQSSGVKTKIELAIARHNGDLNAAWNDLEADKNKGRKPTADEFRFNLLQERQKLMGKGQRRTQQESIRLATIDDFLADKAKDNTTSTSTERAVVIKPEMVKPYQDSVNETTAKLTGMRLLPNDPNPTVNIQGHAVPKTQLIEEQYALDHPGQRIQVQWNPDKKQFQIVRVWETTTSKRTKTQARRGPLNPNPQQDDEEDNGD